jgi:DNA mismatch repair protein MutS2
MSGAAHFKPGDAVQTRLGKGIVREIRNGGRVMVDVHGRALLVRDDEIALLATRGKTTVHSPVRAKAGRDGLPPKRDARTRTTEVDLHGLTVEEALDRVQRALNDALLADCGELRLIHGRSSGRIRAAVHRQLRDMPGVRGFRLDPNNEGVTIVTL